LGIAINIRVILRSGGGGKGRGEGQKDGKREEGGELGEDEAERGSRERGKREGTGRE
jgi:hypothetical protein